MSDASQFDRLAGGLVREIAIHDDTRRALDLLRSGLEQLSGDQELVLILQDSEAPSGFRVALSHGRPAEQIDLEAWLPLLRLQSPKLWDLADLDDPWARGLVESGHRAALAAPLQADSGGLGVLVVASPDPEGPDEELRRFVGQASLLLGAMTLRRLMRDGAREHQRLLEEELRRVLVIHEISSSMGRSLVLRELFSSTVEKMRQILSIDRAVLALLERGDQTLKLISLDFRREAAERLETQENVPVDSSISGRVIGRNAPFLVSNLGEVEHRSYIEDTLAELGMVSYLAVPLTLRDRPMGSFHLGSVQQEAFGEEELGVVTHVAQHLARSVEHARLFQEVQARMQELSALYEVGKTLIQTLDMEELLEKVLHIVQETFRFEHCAILLVDERTSELRITAQRGYDEGVVQSFRADLQDWGITATAARTGQPMYVRDVEQDPRYIRGIAGGRSELALPLKIGEEVLGILDIESPKTDAFSQEEIHALELFATQVALALDKARLFRKVRDQALTDGLTGLLNQRAFHDRLHGEVGRSQRTGHPFSLVLVDMDNLKEINDTRGHLAGNRALCAVAEALRSHAREMDQGARYGGDEFAMILPEADRSQAVAAAERLRKALEAIHLEDVGPMTASFGVATYPEDAEDPARLIVLADRAMYEAKRRGRNRVATAVDLPVG